MVFIYKYNKNNEFDLYKKADSSEFFQFLLELIHFGLNPYKDKTSVESSCKQQCHIHQTVFINQYLIKKCDCDPTKHFTQQFDANNFMHIVYAHEILLHCNKIQEQSKYNLTELQGSLLGMLSALNDQKKVSSSCALGDKYCAFKTTKSQLMIDEPLPKVYIMGISWFGQELSYTETFNFAISIPHVFRIKDIYAEGKNYSLGKTKYRLKAVVCFLGAHYMCFIRYDSAKELNSGWKLYDDGKEVTIYRNWADVINQIINYKIQPTTLVYENIGTSIDSFKDETLASYELSEVHENAQNLEQTMKEIYGEYENNIQEQQQILEQTKMESSSTSSIRKPDGEESPQKKLKSYKKQLISKGIYIFECQHCCNPMVLNTLECMLCG